MLIVINLESPREVKEERKNSHTCRSRSGGRLMKGGENSPVQGDPVTVTCTHTPGSSPERVPGCGQGGAGSGSGADLRALPAPSAAARPPEQAH